MSNSTEGPIDQLVKARWLALGLSQKDLAEVLQPGAKAGNGSGRPDAGRLMQVADALGISHELFQGLAPAARKSESFDTNTNTDTDTETMQTLLELRLLRVFRELQQHDSRRMLIQLAEQIVRRQARPDNAG
jgi:transcriptional regulator with XRE-family HTH domain